VHDTDTRCKRRDGAWVVETCDRDERTPQAMGGWEVAAPLLRPSRAAFIPSFCKNGDATRGARIYAR
jgi:hypothetical protein